MNLIIIITTSLYSGKPSEDSFEGKLEYVFSRQVSAMHYFNKERFKIVKLALYSNVLCAKARDAIKKLIK